MRRISGTNAGHTDNYGGGDAEKAGAREPRDFLEGSRDVADPENHQAYDPPGDRACGSIGQSVKTNGPGQNMTCHAEDQENRLSCPEDFSHHGRPARTDGFE